MAQAAGVSFKTVSRVVNGEGGVSPELVERVEQAIASLGYRPDHRARFLRQSDADATTIGFVLVDVANPFFSTILRGIEEIATGRDCLVLAGSTEGSIEREHQLIDAFVGRRVDGLIVVSSDPGGGPLVGEMERGTPVVFLDLEPALADIDLVRSDHYAGARLATRHLLDHGHRDIAYFGDDPAIFSARLRLQGFCDEMTEAGLTIPSHRILTGDHPDSRWHEITVDHLRAHPPPTALFTAQNFVTIGAARALHDLGWRTTLAHVGFDDVELADVVVPGITTVPQHPRDLGRRAAEILLARIDGDTGPPVREVVAPHLVARGSGEIPPPT